MAISTINQAGLNAPLTLTSPVLTTPNLGTPSALVLTNATGTPSAINLSNATSLPSAALPAGSVIQMTTTGESYSSFTTTAVLADTGFSLSITPKRSNSKIIILASLMNHGGGNGHKTQVVRVISGGSTTAIWGTQGNLAGWYADNAVQNLHFPFHYSFVDTPGTTSVCTYKIYTGPYSAGQQVDFGNGGNYPLSLTALEVAV